MTQCTINEIIIIIIIIMTENIWRFSGTILENFGNATMMHNANATRVHKKL